MSSAAHMLAVETFTAMLGNLSHVLDKGAEHARASSLDAMALPSARLAPDMFPLSLQVQLACHHVEDAAARLTGREPPVHENAEETLEQLKARVQATLERLQRIPAGAFDGADEREIVILVEGGMTFVMKGRELIADWSLPHFYFHVVTAYDILRHRGVELGKRDYLRSVGRHLRRPDA